MLGEIGCFEGCITDADCDDDAYCNGVETCDRGLDDCVEGTNPCISQDLVCNEDADQCVECLDNSDCPTGTECSNNACVEIACTEHRDCPDGFGCDAGFCLEEALPIITAGPFVAAGSWPLLYTKTFTFNQNIPLLWTFDDDYATCEGLCINRAKYRRVDSTQWFELQTEVDATGKWYATTELPVNTMKDGTYVLQLELVDCFGQITPSRYYYFNIAL